jgi:hypothetical protein
MISFRGFNRSVRRSFVASNMPRRASGSAFATLVRARHAAERRIDEVEEEPEKYEDQHNYISRQCKYAGFRLARIPGAPGANHAALQSTTSRERCAPQSSSRQLGRRRGGAGRHGRRRQHNHPTSARADGSFARGRRGSAPTVTNPPAEPGALPSLAPQRGLIATEKRAEPLPMRIPCLHGCRPRSGRPETREHGQYQQEPTAENVKLLRPPRQSRGTSLRVSRTTRKADSTQISPDRSDSLGNGGSFAHVRRIVDQKIR